MSLMFRAISKTSTSLSFWETLVSSSYCHVGPRNKQPFVAKMSIHCLKPPGIMGFGAKTNSSVSSKEMDIIVQKTKWHPVLGKSRGCDTIRLIFGCLKTLRQQIYQVVFASMVQLMLC